MYYPQPPAVPPRRKRNWPVISVVVTAIVMTIVVVVALEISRARDRAPYDQAEAACERAVLARLKAPATAEIYSNSVEEVDHAEYQVAGMVDAQNSFGAMIRNTYVCTVRESGAGWDLVDLDLGS